MALNKLKFNSLNVTPTAGKTIGFNSSANGLEATLSGGSMVFIKKLTASSDSTLNFVNGSSDVVLDSTYKEYLFLFKDIHPADDNTKLQVGFRDGSTDYDATKTSSVFQSLHDEADSTTALQYEGGLDLAQSTSAQALTTGVGNDNDQCASGILHLFNPSSTTFVKHYIARCQVLNNSDYSVEHYTAGYCNVTAAIDAVQFSMTSGNIDAGTITLYGIN